jgi:hypothetical protein
MKSRKSQPNILKYCAPFVWIFLVGTGFTTSSVFLLTSFGKASTSGVFGLYSARSPEKGQTSFETKSVDARTIKIEKVFEKFNCPMVGTGEYLVQKADEHQIPYWLVASVAFQESGCGKKTPKVAGTESYNAWGYGVWGGNVKTFDSWEAGISAVSNYFGVNFFSKGITDPCEIMRTYTPPSKGSWCEGVKYFGKLIENFESE